MEIRPERPSDVTAIRRVNELAFGRPEEADLIEALRKNDAITLSLVAEVEGTIAAHVLFSPVEIENVRSAIGLGPMAVLPSYQRRGIGSRLIRDALDRLREAGRGAVVVLGHPEYYPRFGFTRASSFGLRCEFECRDEAFMTLELVPGALADVRGVVRYRPEFGSV